MTEELIDVLDEQGSPTGTTCLRKEIHATGKWHATVHVFVYRITNGMPEILVHLRSKSKDTSPNTWDPVLGGHVVAGDNPLQTAISEIFDEVGLAVQESELRTGPVLKADKGLDKEFNHTFAHEYTNNTALKFRDGEVQEVRWMSVSEILKDISETPSEWRTPLQEFESEIHAFFI